MKMQITSAAMFMLLTFSIKSEGQKLKLTDGGLSVLKNEISINFEFTYDNMSVGKFDNEKEYVEKKAAEYNKKEAGRGDNWAKSWVNDRQSRFEPKFIKLFTKWSEMSGSKTARYTMTIKTKFTEPGFNIGMGIIHKSAKIDAEVVITETANKNKVIAAILVDDALGRTFGGYDFDTGLRISEAYADAGKALGKFIKKNGE